MTKSRRHVVTTADEINNNVLLPTLSMSRNDAPEAINWNVPRIIHDTFGSIEFPDFLNNRVEYCITPPAPDSL